MDLNQKQEQQQDAALKAIEQARDAVWKATVAGVKWYLTRDKQEKQRLDLGGEPEVDLGYELRDDPEWRLVEAKYHALIRLDDAAEEAAALWLR
ncbi:hypothetical protein AB0L88_03505 [Saccharopolyspora shandongensis]|uniref:hypothetical protein n=1 Tax=Saccharopolyspora shandongensis TaxID=418495 RepID=UPI00344A7919